MTRHFTVRSHDGIGKDVHNFHKVRIYDGRPRCATAHWRLSETNRSIKEYVGRKAGVVLLHTIAQTQIHFDIDLELSSRAVVIIQSHSLTLPILPILISMESDTQYSDRIEIHTNKNFC